MAAQPEILAELRRLRARVPQLTGALVAGVDGLVLAHDTPGVEAEGMAALTATSLAVAVRLADTTGLGTFRELLVRGVHGYVATYAAGESAVLTVLAQDRVNVGRLHLESRLCGTRVGELVDAAERARAPAAAPPPAAAPAPGPAPAPTRTAAARTRSARTPRLTTTEPRTATEPRTTTES
ncbi:roadblock/LC7 domain-containing protein [Streptomyces phaeoluteigriseus]|uniref:roadblock/LC7 domain-containing protein n=1 Tax=Streptomyces phaeoluteigriseus TaxID=114686 RepID=UPI003699895B